MSSERDIDDILESLNQLLREGESHNDDHVEPKEDVKVNRDQLDSAAEMIESELEQFENHDDEVLSSEDEKEDSAEVSAEAAASEALSEESIDESSENLSDAMDDESSDDVSDDSSDDLLDGPVSIQRVVLTEEMLLDNPQGSLLSLVKESGTEEDGVAGEGLPETASQESDSESSDDSTPDSTVETLLEEVSADVMNQLQETLPALIKQSLERHLASLNRASEQSEDKNRDE